MTSTRLRVFAFLLLLPLGLTLLPALQVHRVKVDRDELRELSTRVQRAPSQEDAQALARVRAAAARLQVHEWTQGMAPEALEALVEQRLFLKERLVLGWLGLTGALAALVAGLAVILRLRRDRLRAQTSFEVLLATLAPGWRAVSRGVVLHGALMFAAMLAMGLYEVAWTWSHYATVGWTALLFLLPLWIAIAGAGRLLWHSARSLSPLPDLRLELLGRELAPDAAPGLWTWVRRIAKQLDAPPPDHVVVGLSQGFFVTSAPVCVLPRRQELNGRTLYLPLIYLSALSREEAASIVGHELGHFARQDTENGVLLSVTHRRLVSGLERLAALDEETPSLFHRPALWTSLDYLEQLDLAFSTFSRENELRADAMGARVAGPEAAASALLRVTALRPHVEEALERASAKAGVNAIEALLAALEEVPLTLEAEFLERTLPHPVDTHPPTRVRIDALAVSLDDSLLQRATRPPNAVDTSWFQDLLEGPSRAA